VRSVGASWESETRLMGCVFVSMRQHHLPPDLPYLWCSRATAAQPGRTASHRCE